MNEADLVKINLEIADAVQAIMPKGMAVLTVIRAEKQFTYSTNITDPADCADLMREVLEHFVGKQAM